MEAVVITRDEEGVRDDSVHAVDEVLGALVEDDGSLLVDAQRTAEETLVIRSHETLRQRDDGVVQTVQTIGNNLGRGNLFVLARRVVTRACRVRLIAEGVRTVDASPIAGVFDGLAR